MVFCKHHVSWQKEKIPFWGQMNNLVCFFFFFFRLLDSNKQFGEIFCKPVELFPFGPIKIA